MAFFHCCHIVSPLLYGTLPIYAFLPQLTFCKALLVLCYELLLHPLRNYPGPFIAKLTNGYGGFYAWKRSLHAVTWRDHLTYGILNFLDSICCKKLLTYSVLKAGL